MTNPDGRGVIRLWILLLGALLVLAGCSSSPNKGRYSLKHDRYPSAPVDVSKVPDAVPRVEPRSRSGNQSPYRVLGRDYYVLKSAKGYDQRGIASWYGEKFHGHRTSNGETYDMYKMSAAHKTLPLPSYVRVTNLDNGRQVVVRVNDRGPFHQNRLIDLSYAAAARLKMLGKGTAHVEVSAIDPRNWSVDRKPVQADKSVANSMESAPASGRYLQVGAYSSSASAERVRSEMSALAKGASVSVHQIQRQGGTLYRVLVGPLEQPASSDALTAAIEAAGHPAPILVDYP